MPILTIHSNAPESEHWYRVESYTIAGPMDEWGRSIGGFSKVELRTVHCPVVKHTPKGAWVLDDIGTPRLVITSRNKRYACPTMREALESFIARKNRQLEILTEKVNHAKEAKAMAVAMLVEMRKGNGNTK